MEIYTFKLPIGHDNGNFAISTATNSSNIYVVLFLKLYYQRIIDRVKLGHKKSWCFDSIKLGKCFQLFSTSKN